MAWNFANELARYGPAGCDRPVSLAEARKYCAYVTRSHYENFSVASILLPRRLKPHFEAVYAYCRWSDDLADETRGDATELLRWWREQVLVAQTFLSVNATQTRMSVPPNTITHPILVALADTIARFRIPLAPFLDLLSAFEQDQRTHRYDTWEQLLDYCSRSANPVGRIVLHLFEVYNDDRARLSDEICTGLQLANFWQDIARDFAIGRVYIPAQEMQAFGVTEADIAESRFSPAFAAMMKSLVQRTREYFTRGARLIDTLPFRARMNIGVFHRGGLAVLDAIERQGYNVLAQRPTVSKRKKVSILMRSTLSALLTRASDG